MRIYIRNIHLNASKNELRNLFIQFGKVTDVKIHMNSYGKSLGFGYVIMTDDLDGIDSILELNKINFMNQFLEIYRID